MTNRRISKATAAAKRKSRQHRQAASKIVDILEMAAMTPEQRAFEDELIRVSQYVKTHHAHPGVLNKRVGCKYRGWVKISACGRKGNEYMINRIKAMQFYGDWCPSTKLDEIIPDEFVDDCIKRCYHIDFFMRDIAGTEYEIDTQKIYNPKSMVDLQLQVASLVRSIAEQDGYLFDFDKSYVEIRA